MLAQRAADRLDAEHLLVLVDEPHERGCGRSSSAMFTGYDAHSGVVQVPLYGNHWTFAAGHRIRLDLAQVDQPTYRAPNAAVTATLNLSAARPVLPVRQDAETTVP